MQKMMLKSMLAIFCLCFVFSCKDVENPFSALVLNISGLEDLGSGFAYEGWLIVNGNPVSTGVFSVDGSGNLSTNNFSVLKTDSDNATTFVLTIEPSPDADPTPSDVHILAGDISGTSANLTVDHQAALGNNFTQSTGKYILATPTNGENTDENSGVWWLDPNTGPGPGLSLPVLPAGWEYEGWTVINSIPVSTGRFLDPASADDNDVYSDAMAGPPFPGEDFLLNAPAGLTFPTDLSQTTVVISVEPEPDNSLLPFLLKPLVGTVPASALDHVVYNMNNNAAATNPTGTVTIQ